MKNILLVTAAFLLTSISAKAGFMIEPSLGLRNESLKLTDISSNESEFKMNGLGYGLKLSFASPLGISLGLGGQYFSGKTESTPALSEQPDFNHMTTSLQIGVSAMGLLRIYLGYLISNDLEIKEKAIYPGIKLKGGGYQAGLTFYLFRGLGLNFQYNVNQFKKVSGTQFNLGDDVNTYYDKIDSQDFSVDLSYAF